MMPGLFIQHALFRNKYKNTVTLKRRYNLEHFRKRNDNVIGKGYMSFNSTTLRSGALTIKGDEFKDRNSVCVVRSVTTAIHPVVVTGHETDGQTNGRTAQREGRTCLDSVV